jgi:hypothetical protein
MDWSSHIAIAACGHISSRVRDFRGRFPAYVHQQGCSASVKELDQETGMRIITSRTLPEMNLETIINLVYGISGTSMQFPLSRRIE